MKLPRIFTSYRLYGLDRQTGLIVARRDASNLVTISGLTDLINTYFANGSSQAAWYIGLIKQQAATTGSIGIGSHTLALAAPATVLAGQQITVFGAGASGNLVTTAAANSVSATVSLTDAASTAVSGATTILGPPLFTTDTMTAHLWTEVASGDITQATRPVWTAGGPIASGNTITDSNASNQALYTPNASFYACGLFFVSDSTIGGSTGILFGEAGFSQGALFVSSGGFQLSITVTLQTAAG